MIPRILSVACIALFLSLPLGAKEIALTYGKAPQMPMGFMGFEALGEDEEGWENAKEILTDKAITVIAYYPLGSLADDGLLISVDTVKEGAPRPDTLYVDLDGDETIGKGEKFSLKPPEGAAEGIDAAFVTLCAEKIPLSNVFEDQSAPILMDFFYLFADSTKGGGDSPKLEELPPFLLSITAWGCLSGEVEIGGKDYTVLLIDSNVNGSFADFEEEGEEAQPDNLVLVSSAAAAGTDTGATHGGVSTLDEKTVMGSFHEPLRRRIFLDGKAYKVGVKENGRALVFSPLAVDFGTVAAAADDIEVELAAPGWGSHTVPPGEKFSLPAGTWHVSGFRRIDKKTGAFCAYEGPEDVKVAIAAGKTAAVSLDTTLKGGIKVGPVRKTVSLSLDMATAQGARFSSYNPPASAGPMEGIPFAITDSEGKTVLKDLFHFG